MSQISLSRLLLLCYEYPPLGGGGGRAAAEISAGLAQKGVAVKVLTGGMPHLPKREIVGDVEVIRVCSGRQREDCCSVWEMFLWLLAAFPAAIKLLRHWRPNLIHAHFAVPTGALAWILSRFYKIPYCLTSQLGDVPGGVPKQTAALFRWIYPFTIPIWRDASLVTTVSSFVAQLIEKAYHLKATIIFNGTYLPSYLPPKSPCSARLLMVGRLSLQKNPLLTIKALGLLKEKEWKLTIIGDGPLRRSVEQEILHHGLSERIELLGWVSQKHVHLHMERGDILLMPSLSEGLPLAGIEALARGMIIVGSQIGGLQDLLEEAPHSSGMEFLNGALFPLSDQGDSEQDVIAMADALTPFLVTSSTRLAAQKAASQYAKRFAWERIVEEYYDCLTG